MSSATELETVTVWLTEPASHQRVQVGTFQHRADEPLPTTWTGPDGTRYVVVSATRVADGAEVRNQLTVTVDSSRGRLP